MAMDPAEILRQASYIAGVYSKAEERMTALVARRVERGIDTPGWPEAKAAEVGALRRELNLVVQTVELGLDTNLRELLSLAYRTGAEASAAAIGVDAMATGSSPWAMQALVSETLSGLSSTHLGILRQAQDAYRSAVADATAQAVTGTVTRRAAAQLALTRFADRGITGFVDRAGRRWQLDSYAEMSTRTALQRAHLAGRFDVLTQNGMDLVKVSDSPDECPLCRPWEGKVLSITGETEGFPRLDEARDAGLFHASCTHAVSAYTPGLSRPPTRSTAATADPSGYAERQRQRTVEANVRRWKRREAAAITPQERAKAAAALKANRAELRDLTARTGRRRDYSREGIGRQPVMAEPPPPPPPPRRLATYQEADELLGGSSEDYTGAELEAARQYANSGYHPMNGHLRGNIPEQELRDWLNPLDHEGRQLDLPLEDLMAGLESNIEALTEASQRHTLDAPLQAFRGTGTTSFGLEDDAIRAKAADISALVGQTYTEPGFLSTSVVQGGEAASFSARPMQIHLTLPAGSTGLWVAPHGGIPSESEWLLPPGSRFLVTSASYDDHGHAILDAVLLL